MKGCRFADKNERKSHTETSKCVVVVKFKASYRSCSTVQEKVRNGTVLYMYNVQCRVYKCTVLYESLLLNTVQYCSTVSVQHCSLRVTTVKYSTVL
jgi:hypothetical protein